MKGTKIKSQKKKLRKSNKAVELGAEKFARSVIPKVTIYFGYAFISIPVIGFLMSLVGGAYERAVWLAAISMFFIILFQAQLSVARSVAKKVYKSRSLITINLDNLEDDDDLNTSLCDSSPYNVEGNSCYERDSSYWD